MIDKLKEVIELKFGKSISSRGDCEKLSELVFIHTNKDINYNTLRRLFGLAKPTNPRTYTLDLLSRYVGFESYNDFVNLYTKTDDWEDWENIFDLLDNQSNETLIEYFHKKIKKSPEFNNILIIVCRELLIRKKYITFKTLINQNWLFFQQREYNHIIKLGNSIGSIIHKEQISAEVQISFLTSRNYRDSVYKIYIDYTSFNAGYGKQIDYVYNNLKNFDIETQIFTKALKILKDIFLLGIENGRKNQHELPQKSSTLHPILQGRIIALKLIFAKNNEILFRKLLREYEKTLLKKPEKVTEYLYEVINIAFYFNDFVIFEFIFKLTESKSIHLSHWYHNYHHMMIRLAVIFYYLHCNQLQKANQLFSNYKLLSFRGGYKKFHSLFFHIAKYHIRSDSKEKSEILESFSNISEIAQIKYIDNNYLLNYFSPEFHSPYR
ncbi:MAG: hypothetical protein ACON5K_01995 [Bacteroidia bacterium]